MLVSEHHTRAWGYSSVVEHLFGICKALGSIADTTHTNHPTPINISHYYRSIKNKAKVCVKKIRKEKKIDLIKFIVNSTVT